MELFDWFTASQYAPPFLTLTIELPEGVTVVCDPIPLKPEWNEAAD